MTDTPNDATRAGWMDENRRNWDDRAALHAQLDTGYRIRRFVDDPDHLSDVISFDRSSIGDVDGLDVLHLQCHIGTDTLSLARLGAHVTGLDQSAASLDAARRLFADTSTAGRFVASNVYDAVAALDGVRFDLVYTSVGVLNWLPDIGRWARVVAALLRPGGRVYLRDTHPMAFTLDDEPGPAGDATLRVKYPYFESVDPISLDFDDTYVDTGDQRVSSTRTNEWNHGLGEVFNALVAAGLTVTHFDEHRGLDWKFLDQMVERDGQFFLPDDQIDLCPMNYSMIAVAPGR